MKKIVLILFAFAMMLNVALAEDAANHLTVASTSAVMGNFLNAAVNSNAGDTDVQHLLQGYRLICRSAETGMPEYDPSVVVGHAVSVRENGDRVYSIVLAEDLFYSDGTPVTAYDYAFSLLLSASGVEGVAPDRSYIAGLSQYATEAAETVTGVRIINDHMLSITVSADAYPYFYETKYMDIAPYPIAVIAPGYAVADEGQGVFIRSRKTGACRLDKEKLEKAFFDEETGYASHPAVVSGPYVLVSYDPEDGTAEFALNKHYKGNAQGIRPSIARITYRTVSNQEMPEALRSGDVDLAVRMVSSDAINAILQDRASVAEAYPRSGLAFIRFNTRRAGVEEDAVRKAIYMCLDREEIIADAFGSNAETVDAWYGKNLWVYRLAEEAGLLPAVEHVYSTEDAAQLLEEAGWHLNADGIREKQIGSETVTLELSLLCYDGSDLIKPLRDHFAPALAKAGILLTVEPVTEQKLYARYASSDCNMILASMNFAFAFDPALSQPGMENAELYALAVELNNTDSHDLESYCEKWVEFETKWMDVLPAMPMYTNTYYDFHTPDLIGYPIADSAEWTEAIFDSVLFR